MQGKAYPGEVVSAHGVAVGRCKVQSHIPTRIWSRRVTLGVTQQHLDACVVAVAGGVVQAAPPLTVPAQARR